MGKMYVSGPAMLLASQEAPSALEVLLVTENELLRRALEDQITGVGFPVTRVGDCAEALALLGRKHYPIVVHDWVTPGAEGLELCRTIRSRPAANYTYLVLLTPQGSLEEMIAGLDAGADEYLVKPVIQVELAARLKIARRILELERNLKRSLAEITRLSLRDPLTEVFNRRFLIERLPQEIKRACRYHRPLSLILLDIDHFKVVNDTYGHAAGDKVLQACARIVQDVIREDVDWMVRYGGEEFVVVLPETNFDGALVLAERLRLHMETRVIPINGDGISITSSFGVAALSLSPERRRLNLESLLEAADRCLYQAKQEGRNRVRGLQL